MTDPDAPYDYARDRHESMRENPPVRDAYWNGTNWSERPDPSEYEEGR